MCAVSKQGNHGHAHREDGHGHRNGRERRIFAALFRIFLQFTEFIRHGSSLLESLSLNTALSWKGHDDDCIALARPSRNAAIVRSMSASECAAETNSASNCEGARKTPRSSMARKNAAKRLVSHFFAPA